MHKEENNQNGCTRFAARSLTTAIETLEKALQDEDGVGIIKECDGAINALIDKKMKEYISKYHDHAYYQITTGRYAGYWETHFGKGRADRKKRRFRTLKTLYEAVKEEHDHQVGTLGAYYQKWIEGRKASGLYKPNTIEMNENSFNKYLKGTPLCEKIITEITIEDLDAWAKDVLAKYPMTAKIFNTNKIIVVGPLDLAVSDHIIQMNPWISKVMKYHKLIKATRKRPSGEMVLLPDEIVRLKKALMKGYEDNKNSANLANLVCMDLAIRVGEAAVLKWSDIDWTQGTIFIQRQETDGKVDTQVKADSPAGYREITMTEGVIYILKRLRLESGMKSEFIFVDENGRRRTEVQIRNRLQHAERVAGFDRIKNPHCIRRTAATIYEKLNGMEATRKLLGHTSIETTEKYIYDVRGAYTREEIEATSLLRDIQEIEAEAKQKIS